MKNFILFLSLFLFLAICTESKAQPYYYNSGVPTLFENWGNLPGGGGAHPSSFGENTEYIIESGKTAVLDFMWFIDNSAILRVNSGATLQINYSLNIGSSATLKLDSNATCIYNSTELAKTTIFGGTEIFHEYSNFKIKNWSGVNDPVVTGISASGQPLIMHLYGNLELDWESLNGNWYINTSSIGAELACGNDFRITSSGKGKIIIPIFNYGFTSYWMVKNYIQTGGEIDLGFGFSIGSRVAAVIRVHGNFQKTGGIMDANSVNSCGKLEFWPIDTSVYQTFQNTGTLRNIGYEISNSKLLLMSNMSALSSAPICAVTSESSIIDCGDYKMTGNVNMYIVRTTLKLRSPEGFKNGASGGNITSAAPKQFYNVNFEYCADVPQITGDSLPGLDDYTLSDYDNNIIINNPNGVTLSKDTRMGEKSALKFIQGKLNLADKNFKIGTPDSVQGINQNCFFNTNGTGVVRVGLNGSYASKYPIGNGTFSPFYITQSYSGNNDTIGIRVENGFSTYNPFDTSHCVRKTWRVFDENGSNGTYFRPVVQFMKSDAGSNMNLNSAGSIGNYDPVYGGYMPMRAYFFEQFYTPPDSTISKALYGGVSFGTDGDDSFVAGNEEGVYETFFPDNSGDAAQLGNWISLNGLHPLSFDRYAIFSVPEGRTASFNNPVSFSDKAYLRSTGNGVINANAPITVNGILEIYDSSTYNHNNTGIASQTCFAGREFCHENSNFRILKWSDTADKIFDENELSFGNLTINFTNLPEPFGTNKYWTVFKNVHPYYTSYIIRGNLTYINSSGYQFAPIGYGNNVTNFTVYGNVQIGDSLDPFANPTLNLSGGTTRAAGMTAGSLNICGNLDIQGGRLTSQDFPAVARGKIVFKRENAGVPQSHSFYCFNPLNPYTDNIGSPSFPNIVENDTLILKSDMYQYSSASFLSTDTWQVNSGAAINIDTFKIKGINLTIKNGGKLITKNNDGFYADLANQNIVFEPNSFLEYAGNAPQNLQKDGTYNLSSFPNLIINNPAGVTVNMQNISITNSITFITGKLISNNTNYLTFPDEIQFNSASNNSFLSGPVKLNTTSTGIKTIPTGKGSNYRAVVIIPNSASSTDWLVEYFNQQQPFGSTLGSGITSVSSAEYYLVNRSGAANATIGLVWGANSGVTNPANLRVARWNDFQWEDKGNSGTLGDPSSGIVFSNMITEFSPFAIASTDNQELPVELSSFTAAADRNNVTLNWVTETEENNSGYAIERKSASDTTWKKITFVSGAGNSNTRKIYKYEDRNLMMGNYSYRLKQIDYNGNYKYFTLNNNISVGVPGKFALSQNYPNPFNPTTKINFELPKDSKVTIQLYDMTGRLMASLLDNQSFSAGYHTVEMNGVNFASGTYFYRISAGDFTATKKMQLVK